MIYYRCNVCEEKEKVRATILEMNPDGSGQRVFAKGLRNSVGLRWIGKTMFGTNQGSDHLGEDKPDETFYAVKNNTDYGWPYCHQANGKIIKDPEFKRGKGCKGMPVSYAWFPGHASALGFDYFDDTADDPQIKGSFLVALHGSTDLDLQRGYKIVIVRKGKKNQDFLNGFLQGQNVYGRPCDVFKLDASSFLFTDDKFGVVYYVRPKGWTTQIALNFDEPEKTEVQAALITGELPGGGICLPLLIPLVIAGILSVFSRNRFFGNRMAASR